MRWIDNLKTGNKLLIGFGLLVLLLIGTAVAGLFGLQQVAAKSENMYHNQTLPIDWVGKANAALYKLRGDIYKYLLIPEERSATLQAIEEDKQIIEENIEKYRPTIITDEEKLHWPSLKRLTPNTLPPLMRLFEMLTAAISKQRELQSMMAEQ